MKHQSSSQIVDLSDWMIDDEHGHVFPVGSRNKTLVVSPSQSIQPFLISSHRYLFKKSKPVYPWGFWMEVMAYRIGEFMGIIVPPAFVGINRKNNDHGALIEWFYSDSEKETEIERFVHGGDYMKNLIRGYDYKDGEQHNLDSILSKIT